MPEGLAEVRTRLDETHPGGKAGSTADMELLHTVAVVLTRQPEPVSMGELSRMLDVPLSTATRIMDWLVKSGYAERLPDAQDRRVVRVGLTQNGRQIYQGVNDLMRAQVEILAAKFYHPGMPDPDGVDAQAGRCHGRQLVVANEGS